MTSIEEALRRTLNLATHRVTTVPVLVLMPHGGCNCRCVMCDIWKANRDGRILSESDLSPHVESIRRLRVQRIVFSGGEALLHPNLWSLCALLEEVGAARTLLSSGLLLERSSADISRWLDEVIVSIDGSRSVHDRIRRVRGAFDRLARGVKAVRAVRRSIRVTGRCVLQKENYRDLSAVVDAARSVGLDQISFLAADVSSSAFNRPHPWDAERMSTVTLDRSDVAAFATVVETFIREHPEAFSSGFVAESPERLRMLPRYYAGLLGDRPFPAVRCNAPWMSAVIEADGAVRPCFFHEPYGNIEDGDLMEILNSPCAVSFRRRLSVADDDTCRRCVCSLRLGVGQVV